MVLTTINNHSSNIKYRNKPLKDNNFTNRNNNRGLSLGNNHTNHLSRILIRKKYTIKEDTFL